MDEEKDVVKTSVVFQKEFWRKVKVYAAAHDENTKETVKKALEEYLQSRGVKV